MSEQIREQVSAFLDGELPNSEAELLLKRLTRDAELRESFGRYALIGESLRGATPARLSHGFPGRVNRAIDGEAPAAEPVHVRGKPGFWWRPFAGVAVAAGVATIAVVALQQRAVAPTFRPSLAVTVPTAAALANAGSPTPREQAMPREALSYTVPAPAPDAPMALPAARFTNYVFAHSKYSTVLGQNDVLNDLLSGDGEDAAAVAAAAAVGGRLDEASAPRPSGTANRPPEAHVAP